MKPTFPQKRGSSAPEPTGLLFGYARVSTSEQRLDMQLDALKAAGVPEDNIYVEKVSGASKRRPAWERCVKALRSGDTLIVWKIDRVGRKNLQVLQWLDHFRQRGIIFKSLTEPIDFQTPIGEVMVAMAAAFSQFERSTTVYRTKTGMAAGKARGAVYGRKVEFDLVKAKQYIRKGLNVSQAAERVGVDRRNLFYHVKQDPELMRLLAQREKAAKKQRPKRLR